MGKWGDGGNKKKQNTPKRTKPKQPHTHANTSNPLHHLLFGLGLLYELNDLYRPWIVDGLNEFRWDLILSDLNRG